MAYLLKCLVFVALTAWAAGGAFGGESERPWRVVVQDVDIYSPGRGASVRAMAVTPDGRYAVVRAAETRHVIHLVDIPNARTALTVHLPERDVMEAAIAPDGRALAVVTYSYDRRTGDVYLIGVEHPEPELLIEDFYGELAFDAEGKRLALLGIFSDFGPERQGRRWWWPRDLGLFDLVERRWIARAATPIGGRLEVLFDGESAVAYGVGVPFEFKEPFPRASNGGVFQFRTILDGVTGDVSTERGAEVFFREPWMRRSQPHYGDYGYEEPEPVLAVKEALAAACETLREIIPLLLQSGSSVSGGFAAIEEADGVRFMVGSGPHKFVRILSVSTDGVTEFGRSPSGSSNDEFASCGGMLHLISRSSDHLEVHDPEVQKPRLRIPGNWIRGEGYRYEPAPEWLLTRRGDEVAFHSLVNGEKLGSLTIGGTDEGSGEANVEKIITAPVLCPDYSRAVIPCEYGRGNLRLKFVEAPSARELDVIRIDDCKWRWEEDFAGMAFSEDGESLAVVLDRSKPGEYSKAVVQIYDVSDGDLKSEMEIPDVYAKEIANAGGDEWLVKTSDGLRHVTVMSGDGQYYEPFEHTKRWRNIRVRPLAPQERLWVLVGSRDYEGIFDLAANTVVKRWVSGGRSIVAFGGRLLVRPAAYRSDVDFVDIETMETLFTLHPLPGAEGAGWVAATPDGFWDASPGAEKYVMVFRGLEPAGEEAARGRRRDGLVGRMLTALEEPAERTPR